LAKEESFMLSCYIRARRPDGSECTINLVELEDALTGARSSKSYFVPDSGKIIFSLDADDLADDQEEPSDSADVVPIDPISSHVRFGWMEEFVDSVRSVSLQTALRNALRHKKPFRNFRDALMQYPVERQNWFHFEAQMIKAEAVALIEGFDWEIWEVIDRRPAKQAVPIEIDPAERVPLTNEEHEWILRGASAIAARGGRTQLALLLKGSKNKALLKHNLQGSPAYGRLSFLTLEEIEHRIDRLIRKGELRVEFFGDLPLILLSDESWDVVRPWANAQEWKLAVAASERTFQGMLLQWRNRPRAEQFHVIDAAATLSPDDARRLLKAWQAVAGKEVRAYIEAKLNECAS
jgi:hypothetical protein